MLDVKVLGSSDWRVRREALERAADTPDVVALVAELVEVVAEHPEELNRFNAAVQLLAQLDPRHVVPALRPLISHPHQEVRVACALLLSQSGSPLAGPFLQELSHDENANVVWQALEGIGQTGVRDAVPRALELARAEDFGLAFAAVEVLGKLGDVTVLPDLIELLGNELLASAAALSLGVLGHPAAIAPLLGWLEQPGSDADSVLEALEQIRRHTPDSEFRRLAVPAVTDAVRLVLSSARPSARLARLWSDLLPSESALENLGALLERPDAQSTAAAGLARAGGAGLPAMAALLRSSSQEARKLAIRSLGAVNDAQAAQVLLEVVAGAEPETSVAAAEALGNQVRADTLPLVLEALQNSPPEIVAALLQSAGQQQPDLSSAQIRAMLRDPDARIRLLAVSWLDPSEPLDLLVEALEDPDRRVRARAVQAMGRRSLPAGLFSDLERCYLAGPRPVRTAVLDLLARYPQWEAGSLVVGALQQSELWTPMHALRCLGEWRQRRHLAAVEPLLSSPLPPLRAEAALAWGRMAGEPQVLASLLSDPHREVQMGAMQGLSSLGGDSALELLLGVLPQAHVQMRRELLRQLAAFPQERALDALMDALARPDDVEVALAALAANPAAQAETVLLSLLGTAVGHQVVPLLASRVQNLDLVRARLGAGGAAALDAAALLARIAGEEEVAALCAAATPWLRLAFGFFLAGQGRWDLLRHCGPLSPWLSAMVP